MIVSVYCVAFLYELFMEHIVLPLEIIYKIMLYLDQTTVYELNNVNLYKYYCKNRVGYEIILRDLLIDNLWEWWRRLRKLQVIYAIDYRFPIPDLHLFRYSS